MTTVEKTNKFQSIANHEWTQLATVLITIFGLFLWSHSEYREGHKELRASTESQLSAIRQDMKEFREIWSQETKDFHGRLCAIQERNKQ